MSSLADHGRVAADESTDAAGSAGEVDALVIGHRFVP